VSRQPVEPVAPQRQQQSPAQTRQDTQPAQQQQPSQSTTIAMSEEQLQKLAQSLRPQAAAPVAPAATPQMTDEEFAKTFNVHKVTPEEYEAILGIKPDSPARVAALDAALQGVSRQSVTLARAMMDQMRQELMGQIQPARQAMLAQEMREDYTAFMGANKDLNDYSPLLQEIVISTKAKIDAGQMPNFRSKAEAATFVASTARKLLNLQASQPGGQQQQQQPPSRQQGGARSMSTTSMGGRTGSSGGAAPVQGLAERLFSEQNT
jgi:hypothetical protein